MLPQKTVGKFTQKIKLVSENLAGRLNMQQSEKWSNTKHQTQQYKQNLEAQNTVIRELVGKYSENQIRKL